MKKLKDVLGQIKNEAAYFNQPDDDIRDKYYGRGMLDAVKEIEQFLNTYQECELLPSELLKQNKELREALEEIQKWAPYIKRHSHAHYREQLKEIFEITEKALKP